MKYIEFISADALAHYQSTFCARLKNLVLLWHRSFETHRIFHRWIKQNTLFLLYLRIGSSWWNKFINLAWLKFSSRDHNLIFFWFLYSFLDLCARRFLLGNSDWQTASEVQKTLESEELIKKREKLIYRNIAWSRVRQGGLAWQFKANSSQTLSELPFNGGHWMVLNGHCVN